MRYVRSTLVAVAFILLFSLGSFAQSQLPDAPAPQQNAPPPSSPSNIPSEPQYAPGVTPPASTQGGDQGQPAPGPDQNAPRSSIETVPKGQQPPDTPGSGSDQLGYLIKVNVNFVPVPVTVKDDDGHLVPGLLKRDFAIFENGVEQNIAFFSSDPFPLSAAVVLDLGMSNADVRKIRETLSALDGDFSPYDEISVYTYGNTVRKVQDFTNADALLRTLKYMRETVRGENEGVPVTSGPLASGPTINGKPAIEGTPHVQNVEQPARVMNDAILQAALDLAARPANRRKVIFVISDGYEKGSRTSYSDVMRVLLSKEVAVYGIGVDAAAIPIYRSLDKRHIPGLGTGNILPRYASATGGDVFPELSREAIENAYQQITLEARNQYTLGYTTKVSPVSTRRQIEVRVHRPGLRVYAKEGYFPLPPAPAKPGAPPASPAADQKPPSQ